MEQSHPPCRMCHKTPPTPLCLVIPSLVMQGGSAGWLVVPADGLAGVQRRGEVLRGAEGASEGGGLAEDDAGGVGKPPDLAVVIVGGAAAEVSAVSQSSVWARNCTKAVRTTWQRLAC